MKIINKKKLLIISGYFYPEDFMINELATEWVNSGYSVTVLTQNPSYPFGKVYQGYKNNLFHTSYFGKIKIYHFYTVQGYQKSLLLKILNYIYYVIFGSLIALMIGYRFDKIFIYQIGPLTTALPGVLIKKVYRKKLSIWTQDLWPDSVYSYGFKKAWYLNFFLNQIVKIIYSNCDNIFVSCEGFITKIRLFVPDKPVHYFPNWTLVKKDKTRNKKISLSKKFNFTFAGNIGKVQNLENVINGFSLAVINNENIQLNIIGDGSNLLKLKEIVLLNKIKNIVFWGRKKLNDMALYLNASDVLIISLNDSPVFELTVPSKFQAYLAVEKPIFCIMKGEVEKMVKKYNIGITAKPSNILEIKNGFNDFFNMSKKERLALTKNSVQLLNTVFNKEKIIKKMTHLIDLE